MLPVERYALRMHRLLDGSHGVCSPLGAWLLLALVADSATDADRAQLAGVLGCDPAAARVQALGLLRDPHPDVAAAAACWVAPAVAGPGFDRLRAAISPPADTGPVPTQQQADAWAAERTSGLIETFPVELGPLVVTVLATALACRISWTQPYELADPDELVRPVVDRRFAGLPMLQAPDKGTWSGIVDARFAAHCARSPSDLAVASVIGAPADDPADVLAVAQRTATAFARGALVPGVTALVDLPLGDGPAWRITKHRRMGVPEHFKTLLPAWQATSDHDLLAEPDLGFRAAGSALGDLLDAPALRPEAKQAAVARYSRTGFEAAAVTAMAMRASALGRPGEGRSARLEFTHPYAVVAATGGGGPWEGLPVFSAWVAEPSPAA